MTRDDDWQPGDPVYPPEGPWLGCVACGAGTLGGEIGMPCPMCGAPLSQRLTTEQMHQRIHTHEGVSP